MKLQKRIVQTIPQTGYQGDTLYGVASELSWRLQCQYGSLYNIYCIYKNSWTYPSLVTLSIILLSLRTWYLHNDIINIQYVQEVVIHFCSNLQYKMDHYFLDIGYNNISTMITSQDPIHHITIILYVQQVVTDFIQ